MIVTPAPGALVRDPLTKVALAPRAEINEHEPYFARLLADGDLVPASDEPAPAEPPAVAPAAIAASEQSDHSSEDAA